MSKTCQFKTNLPHKTEVGALNKLEEFFNDLGVNENLKNDLIILVDDQNDIGHFVNTVCSPGKGFEEMISEMKSYKLLNQGLISESVFKYTYLTDPIAAMAKLFRHHISIHDWNEIEDLMKVRKLSNLDVYNLQVKNVERNFICNAWQTIL
ncbi:hypothetical protein [Bacillus sp. AFS019443]|uniref:hypothetical protein n=1 Tax=Bacillus sp. AFS019443 TaxID=2034279 RepID=UPI000BF4A18D|nr:hypothetical protein [Bacillus sp. AFS019443]PEU05836.1 hypothetical protein CN524_24755 [Bacillus sp. AFS019443]